jgi:hypothetical protein
MAAYDCFHISSVRDFFYQLFLDKCLSILLVHLSHTQLCFSEIRLLIKKSGTQSVTSLTPGNLSPITAACCGVLAK